jgi:DNA-binding MarR family transcriptional regulator
LDAVSWRAPVRLRPQISRAAKILDGLERLSLVMRGDARRAAAALGINAAQDAILRLLLARPNGLRVQELANHLNVRQPTITDSLSALERKGLIERLADPDDGRAIIVQAAHNALPRAKTAMPMHTAAALAELSEAEQTSLLKTLIKLIRSLQLQNAIPPQRLCVTCKYFHPNVHPDARAPHHCAFVDAAFGDGALRLDCSDQEQAEAAEAARNWRIFVGLRHCQETPPSQESSWERSP